MERRGEQVFVVDIGLYGLIRGIYENDVVGELKAFDGLKAFPNLDQKIHLANKNDDVVVVDLMLLLTQNIVDTFPDNMTQTLMEHLVFKANQTFFDSHINMRLRLVHNQFIDYPNPSSIVTLHQL